ncbi:HNH endonuclease [Gryllotalpicola ginsengisoli]|uniref:HNH endonuclease n=1 Tax=Gryllotalpicola ginsengisoli TaxID=444608 RepID=UPI0003B43F32|nr:HNH endonuclease signature motif containing protein [Gryllotalpicola ginsengisoli]
MTTADPFELDVENSAFALSREWEARQISRVVEIRAQIAALEAEEARIMADLILQAQGEAAELEAEFDDPDTESDRRARLHIRSLATELAASTHSSLPTIEARMNDAWVLVNRLPATFAALSRGELSRAHAQAMVSETDHLPHRGEAEAALLPWAKELSVAAFRRKAARVLERLEPESLATRHERAFARRHVALTPARDGMARLEALIDAADAVVIKTGLENAAAEARSHGDTRTGAQLEADLLVDVLADGEVTIGAPSENAAASLRDRAPVAVTVLIPAETLAGADEKPAVVQGHGVIDPAAARRLVAAAPSLIRVLTDPISSAVVDFDRRSYRIPAELKRVIRLRDGHCRGPSCSAPLSRTEIDHTVAYAGGGTTARWNLAHLCANHHHLKHEAGWGLRQYADGVLSWRSPTGRIYRTHPDDELEVLAEPGPPDPAPFAPLQPAPFDKTE